MKQFQRLVIGSLVALLCIGMMQAIVRAEGEDAVTDAQLAEISGRCSDIKVTLSRIHANDALVRVNRGQLYERISTKLMAPLNSRIALNRLDSSKLVSLTTSYESHLGEFRSSYQTYEVLLSGTMRINCASEPAKFYYSLQRAREERAQVYTHTQDLANDITEYKKAFDIFAEPYKATKT